ncbi:MAG: hypothetical protein HY347_05235 [candidate division NC10 bacterium]|nr:hypothetical protein [candidate division NC10 bacterium]
MTKVDSLGILSVMEQKKDNPDLKAVLLEVQRATGSTLAGYREVTLKRRLDRRLRARGVASLAEYRALLAEDPAEPQRLLDDLTITVTGFFREREAFEALQQTILPLLSHRSPIRIWCAGCATGEEAYSIGMVVLEEARKRGFTSSILATDLNRAALAKAKSGLYPRQAVTGLKEEQLTRYFLFDGAYQVNQALKGLIRFEPHDLTSDPPPRGMDIIFCRNVLIYYDEPTQVKICSSLVQALNLGGFLLLGKVELPKGPAREDVTLVDPQAKAYRKLSLMRVVVIGASAGGIDALTTLLGALPADIPASFLIVQHRWPTFRSNLADLLGRGCPFRVKEAVEGDFLKPGEVLLAPADHHLLIRYTRATLTRSEPIRFVRPSADLLFESAARYHKETVIGVILSGTGKDGTDGAKAIKAQGGLVLAQDPATTTFPEMPLSAIRAGVVDHVLSLEGIAQTLAALCRPLP